MGLPKTRIYSYTLSDLPIQNLINGKIEYYYFYKITNLKENMFYVGIHKTRNLDDGYSGSSKNLQNDYNRLGISNFKKEIIKFFNSFEDCCKFETAYLKKVFKDPNCYNLTANSSYESTNYLKVKDTDGRLYTVKKDDPRYLTGIFVSKSKNTIWIHLEEKSKMVEKEELNKYILDGWKIGRGKLSKGDKKITINNGDQYMRISENQLNDFLEQGWKLGLAEKNIKYLFEGRVYINDGTTTKRVFREEAQKYLKNGWSEGKSDKTLQRFKEKLWVNKENEEKFIHISYLSSYLKEGWSKGRIKREKVAINNGISNLSVSKEKLEYYLNNGWEIGKIEVKKEEKIFVIKDDKIKQLKISNVKKWLNKGWKEIKFEDIPEELRFVWIHKDNNKKWIQRKYLKEYLDSGWILGMYYNRN